ncbi:hypothetical protein DF186_23800, partial [Enterococcus hirae]
LLLATRLDERQRELARTVDASADTLLGLINDILDYSKVEAGKLVIERVGFDLRDQVEDTVAFFAEAARSQGLGLWCFV